MEKDINKSDVIEAIAQDVYTDLAKPAATAAGEVIGLVPRAIKAALLPLEKWVVEREYNLAMTKKLLEEKLKSIPPEYIVQPDAHVAVPAIQYISYCMDNEELRNMYANLLANSMNRVVKNGVHPGYVEIIKQLSPDEAKILKYMHTDSKIPTLGIKVMDGAKQIEITRDLTNVMKLAGCEITGESRPYIDNLVRLGLIEKSRYASFADKKVYEPLKNDPHTRSLEEFAKMWGEKKGYPTVKYEEGFIELTEYGRGFCFICLTVPEMEHIEVGVKDVDK